MKMVNTARNSADIVQNNSQEEQKNWYLSSDGTLKTESVSRNEGKISMNTKVKEGDKLYLDNNTGKISKSPNANSQLIENFEDIANDLAVAQQNKKQEEIEEEKEAEKKNQDIQAEDLKRLLEDTNENGDTIEMKKEDIQKIIEARESLKKENSGQLEEFLEAKKSKDKNRINNLRQIIRRITEERNELKNKYENAIEYDGKKIDTLKTKWINGRGPSARLKKDSEGREISIKLPSIGIIKNRRSRRKLNKLVKYFNKVKNDPEKAMKYILTQVRGDRVDNLLGAEAMTNALNRGGYNFLYGSSRLFTMSRSKLEEQFDFKKEELLKQFSDNIQNPSEQEKDIITAIEQRMDYYKDAYMRKHYGITAQKTETKVIDMFQKNEYRNAA